MWSESIRNVVKFTLRYIYHSSLFFIWNFFRRKRNRGVQWSNYGPNFDSNNFSELTDNEFPGKKISDDELLKDGDENILDSKIFRLLTFFPHHESEEFTVSQNSKKSEI